MERIHFFKRAAFNREIWDGMSSCGIPFLKEEKSFLTINRNKVTCKNCKRTDDYKK